MLRPALLCLRWKIKTFSFLHYILLRPFLFLWHWSAKWKWYDLFFIGGFGLTVAIHEYAIGIFCLSLCAFSGISQIWHTHQSSSAKVLESMIAFVLLSFLCYVCVREKADKEWSWAMPPLRGIIYPLRNGLVLHPPWFTDVLKIDSQIKQFPVESKPTISPAEAGKKPSPPPQIKIEVPPVFGDLRERALTLAKEIQFDLYKHGWPAPDQKFNSSIIVTEQMPTDSWENRNKWMVKRSDHFDHFVLRRVLDIRNEFAQLHYPDRDLDDTLGRYGVVKQPDGLMAMPQVFGNYGFPITPFDIWEVGERLKVLAGKLPN